MTARPVFRIVNFGPGLMEWVAVEVFELRNGVGNQWTKGKLIAAPRG